MLLCASELRGARLLTLQVESGASPSPVVLCAGEHRGSCGSSAVLRNGPECAPACAVSATPTCSTLLCENETTARVYTTKALNAVSIIFRFLLVLTKFKSTPRSLLVRQSDARTSDLRLGVCSMNGGDLQHAAVRQRAPRRASAPCRLGVHIIASPYNGRYVAWST